MVSQTQLIGVSNNPPYSDLFPVTIVPDGIQGVYRLAVSQGIPMINNTSGFISVNQSQFPYTVPLNATFYIVNISAGNGTGLGQGQVINITDNGVVTQTYPVVTGTPGPGINVTGYFPILIALQGDTISLTSIGTAGALSALSISGYLIYGTTN